MLKIVIGTNEGKVLCISNNEDEIRVLRKALWGKSYDRPKQNRYNSTPVRFTFPDGEVKEFRTQLNGRKFNE